MSSQTLCNLSTPPWAGYCWAMDRQLRVFQTSASLHKLWYDERVARHSDNSRSRLHRSCLRPKCHWRMRETECNDLWTNGGVIYGKETWFLVLMETSTGSVVRKATGLAENQNTDDAIGKATQGRSHARLLHPISRRSSRHDCPWRPSYSIPGDVRTQVAASAAGVRVPKGVHDKTQR